MPLSLPRRLAPSHPALLFVSLTLALGLAAPAARAGSYVGAYKVQVADPNTYPAVYKDSTTPTQYSGGTVYTVTVSQTHPSPTFGDAPDIVTTGSCVGDSNGYPGHSDCSHAISTSWQWVPAAGQTLTSDPPPAQVIVMQTCSVSVSIGQIGASGSYRTGLSKTTGTANLNPPGSLGMGGASDTVYSVQTGGASVSLPSLDAYAKVGAAPSESKLSYTANIYPVTISLIGTYNSAAGDYRALTGQQITATLAEPNGLPSGTKITKYTWSFGGGSNGNPIKNWDYTNNLVQLVPFLPADLTKTDTTGSGLSVPAINFYDQTADKTVTATCTINLKFPDGTTNSVTAVSPTVIFAKPTAVWNVNSTDPTYTGPPPGPYFDGSAAGQMGYIEKWKATITVPPPFSGGSGCFGQVIYPSLQFQRKPLNNKPPSCYLKIPQTNPDGTISYVLPANGLDSYFPYALGMGASGYQIYPSGYTWDVNSTGLSADTPSAMFTVGASDTGGNDWYKAYATEVFTTWLMYIPPVPAGSGPSIWVPLQKVDWNWTGNVVKNSATGVWNTAVSGKPPVTGSTSNSGVLTDIPPQWNSVNIGANVLYP